MVRKVIVTLAAFALIACCASTVQAASTPYAGNISTTYVTYFKDILSTVDPGKDYVAYRATQYSYVMVVGEIEFQDNTFTGKGKQYTISTDSGYNNELTYIVSDVDYFSLSVTDELVYSNLGDYPQLIDLGEHYEILQTITLWIALCMCVIWRIFRKR